MPENPDKVYGKNKPEWLKIKLHNDPRYAQTARIVEEHGLHTICSSGMCPNKAECWSRRTATFMILGSVCTRNCRFCATQTGKPLAVDPGEARRLADSIRLMGLKHAVITSVTRDDLPDGGAAHWAAAVEAVRASVPHTTIELLIPDMDGRGGLIDVILAAGPDIVGHNLETVRRLTPLVRSRARYETSLQTIRHTADSGFAAKSGLMLGMGETEGEVLAALDDLAAAGCRIVTLGQYLQPTRDHYPVARYVTPEEFDRYRGLALERGFDYVASGPMVRSSYMAERAAGSCKPKIRL